MINDVIEEHGKDSAANDCELEDKPRKGLLKRLKDTTSKLLSAVSVGQYRTTLYYNGGQTYSSSIGGLATIILAIVMISISFSLLMNCF